MMTPLFCAERRRRRLTEIDISPPELAAIVLTALGVNGFTYGSLLYLNGESSLVLWAILAGSGLLGLAAAISLVAIYEFRAIVSE